MDEFFSLFLSLGKYTSERVSLADSFEAMQKFSTAHGVSITHQRLERDDRMLFDLVTDQTVSVTGCDMQHLTHASESIAIFGANEWELRQARLFDENNIGCFIAQLAVLLFLQGEYHIGLVATEDSFTSLSFQEFHPGYWTIFRSDMLPAFVAGLPYESVGEGANVYRHDQLILPGCASEHMGRDIRNMLKSTVHG